MTSAGLLLDTHVLLWWLGNDARLGAIARSHLSREDNRLVVSVASVWEIAIKRARGKLRVRADLEPVLDAQGIESLPIELSHAEAAGALPDLHRDPFDRMLVAQAIDEGLVLVTADAKVAAYEVTTLDASS